MGLRKEELVVFKHFSGLDVVKLNEAFVEAASGGVRETFMFGLRMYNMVGGIKDSRDMQVARGQAVSLMSEAAMQGDLDAKNLMLVLARQGVPEATDFLENMNERAALRQLAP